MKIVIAPDSFKENLTSLEVATAIERGIRRVLPKARCVKIPMADGGEGTVQSLVDATAGSLLRKRVRGPRGEPVSARYGIVGDGETAVIEMAEASGLPLIPRAERNPLETTTYGTGELIVDAMSRGIKSIIIGIGGSATVDCGTGMAQALGVKFIGANGKEITTLCSGGMLGQIAKIDMSGLDPRVRKARIIIASDVDNPLYGRRGAAYVFGPQKGATPEMVKLLDSNLRRAAVVIKRDCGIDVAKLKGGGAAGGLGAGLVAFARARMKRGVDLVIEATQLKRYLRDADLVITGEGRVDFQTAFGKTPAGVAKAAKKFRVPVVAIGGGLADDARGVYSHGIDALEAVAARDMDLAEALRLSRQHLENAGERVMRLILIGKSLGQRRAARVPRPGKRTFRAGQQ
ncbi:MAG: Glycerate 2-kinase [Chromatiales bacterium USCg_Taylor]|nr:MAG: Glycerate 2-kinase [Chromatiales bacterium USCg_Taylor]